MEEAAANVALRDAQFSAAGFEGDCELELCTFDTPDGRETFWHSSAHLLGLTLELGLGADLTIGTWDCARRGAGPGTARGARRDPA